MPSRSVPFGVKPRTWSATSSPRKPSMGSPASNPYAPTPRACWIPAANTGVLKTVSTTFATSPLMKIARASAVAQAPRSWPPFAISPYRFSASPELATSPQHFAAVLVRAIPSSFASSGCDFDVAVHHFRRHSDPVFFTSTRPGPRSQPKKSAARELIIELRKQNHSVYEISEALKEQNCPLSPTAVREVLKEEGFAALPRRLDTERPDRPRPTIEPIADVRNLSLAPRTFATRCGGLFLFVPDLVRLKLDQLAQTTHMPGSKMIPAEQALRSCLALKLWSIERHS